MQLATASFLALMTVTAAPKERVAVMDFDARGVDASVAENVTLLVAGAARRQKRFDVTTKKDIEKLLHFEESRQAAGGSSDSATLAQMAGTLGISKLMNGSIGKLGSQYVLALNLMDSVQARVLASETVTLKAKDDALPAAVEQLVKGLFEHLEKEANKDAAK
jgi:hypothetical protein